MGQSRKRTVAGGKVRYTAYYDDLRGRRRSAGTFSTRKAADSAWRDAEALQHAGPGDVRAGQQRFADYVTNTWFPNHILEPSTRQSYQSGLRHHILPWFGTMRIGDILPIHVREWVVDLMAKNVSPATIRHQKIILSAIFTTALNDFVIRLHPCRGVKSPTVPVKPYRILTPQEVARLLIALPNDPVRLLVEVFIGSGLRWGEAIELRPADLDLHSGILTVSRSVVELEPSVHPTGGRFHVKPYPKNRLSRRLRLDPSLVSAIVEHTRRYRIESDHLLFTYDVLATATTKPTASTQPTSQRHLQLAEDLGLTEPNASGRVYAHGSLSAYTAGACRCEHCRQAFSRYRAVRRANGLDDPRGPRATPDTDGHLPRNWWYYQVWYPACKAADLDPRPRTHDLRHSHASWLLAGGADLEVVRQRLGHGSIVTTGKYVHTLPTADDTALRALARTRSGEYARGRAP